MATVKIQKYYDDNVCNFRNIYIADGSFHTKSYQETRNKLFINFKDYIIVEDADSIYFYHNGNYYRYNLDVVSSNKVGGVIQYSLCKLVIN
tara:strand:- start:274 stop:546 length:273 start_codon:yes stop_codon:yes gene_type:complete